MESLPDTASTAIFAYLDTYTRSELGSVSKSIKRTISKLETDSYYWKLMVEGYLRRGEIPLTYLDWKEVYEYVTSIQGTNKLLFVRNVFYAKLGLFLGVDLLSSSYEEGDNILSFAVNNASLEAVSYLLSLPELHDEWKNFKYLHGSMTHRRSQVSILLIEDGRCFFGSGSTNRSNGMKSFAIEYSVACNLPRVFFHLIDMYPGSVPDTLIDSYDEIGRAHV